MEILKGQAQALGMEEKYKELGAEIESMKHKVLSGVATCN